MEKTHYINKEEWIISTDNTIFTTVIFVMSISIYKTIDTLIVKKLNVLAML